MQSRFESMVESTLNIASGFIVSYLVWMLIVPVFWPEHASSPTTAFGIVALFTVSSWLRSYVWRRIFNKRVKPNNYCCNICKTPITQFEATVNTNNGFAHYNCYFEQFSDEKS